MENAELSQTLYHLLNEDVSYCLTQVMTNDNQCNRRSFVRAAFACLEASIYELKEDLLKRFPRLPLKERAVLREITYDLQPNGKITEITKYHKLENSLVFAVETFARKIKSKVRIDKSSREWQCFIQSIKMRHRITHPKSIDAIDIDKKEIGVVIRVCLWFDLIMAELFSNAVVYYGAKANYKSVSASNLRKMKDWIDKLPSLLKERKHKVISTEQSQ